VPLPGEDKVFPVRGPVDKYLGTHRSGRAGALKSVDNALRVELSDRISVLNQPVR
jgi:hypothetical protein